MSEWFLYIIQCNDGTFYTGITTDVGRRFAEHVAQGRRCAKYVKGKGPLALVFSERVGDKGPAYRMERKVKSLPKKRKMALIHGTLKMTDLL